VFISASGRAIVCLLANIRFPLHYESTGLELYQISNKSQEKTAKKLATEDVAISTPQSKLVILSKAKQSLLHPEKIVNSQ